MVADDVATTRAKEQQKNVSQVEYAGKRKESTSQVLTPGLMNFFPRSQLIFSLMKNQLMTILKHLNQQ